MKALILDTETHDLHGFPIEIAHMEYVFIDGVGAAIKESIFDEYYSMNEGVAISWGAMAVHNILQSDIENKPHFTNFELPADVEYIIGHNVKYDIDAIARCHLKYAEIKGICTLALARHTWPKTDSHTLSALVYMLENGSERARSAVRGAHNAAADIKMTAFVLKHIVEKNSIKTLKDLYQLSELARTPKNMPFGKHKGMPIKELPASYIAWFFTQDLSETDPYLIKALKRTQGK